MRVRPADQFDAVVHVDETHALSPLDPQRPDQAR
jgi:erythromycin esterase-like protein